MRRSPTPRRRIFDLYWYFAAERQQIFERRVAGKEGPWTSDDILRTYKFCNVYRAADRVSQYLIREIICGRDIGSWADQAFRIVAFRTFSSIETWNALCAFLGHSPTLKDLNGGSFTRALERAKSRNGKLYTNAFILCAADAYGKTLKHLNHIELFRHMFLRDQLGRRLADAKSLHGVYKLLRGYPLMGDFMSYQVAIDLNYSEVIDFSENDFTQPGPGAIRGIRKVFEDLGDYTPAEIVLWMVARQEAEFRRRTYRFGGLWGRPLHAIDCQGLFCETDKYCRVAAPELVSGRKRIKTKFSPSAQPMELFFPPKWGINERIAGGKIGLRVPVGGRGWRSRRRLETAARGERTVRRIGK